MNISDYVIKISIRVVSIPSKIWYVDLRTNSDFRSRSFDLFPPTLQNRTACLHQGNSNITLHLNELHWLPVEKRIRYKILDKKLGFSSFINSTCAKSFYHLRRITSIRKYLSFDLTKLLILTFVISRLDYCNSLLYGAPDYMIKKLQRVQNRVAVNRSNFSGRKDRGRTFWSNCRDRMEWGRIFSYLLYSSVASLPSPSSNIEAWP